MGDARSVPQRVQDLTAPHIEIGPAYAQRLSSRRDSTFDLREAVGFTAILIVLCRQGMLSGVDQRATFVAELPSARFGLLCDITRRDQLRERRFGGIDRVRSSGDRG